MDAISYAHSAKQEQRIKKFINDPDSTSGVLTVPKVIASGESVTIPAGRVAVMPNVRVDGTLNVQGDVFVPAGATYSSANITSDIITTTGGSVSTPSYSFASDTDTGLSNPAANTVAISTGGSERVRVDASGNVGIGVTPSAWGGAGALELQHTGLMAYKGYAGNISANGYYNNGWKYSTSTGAAALYTMSNGAHTWQTAPSGTAGNAITWTQAMNIENNTHTTIGLPVTSYTTGAQLRVEQAANNNASTASLIISRYSDNYSSALWHCYNTTYSQEAFNLSVSPAGGGNSLTTSYKKYMALGDGNHFWYGATTSNLLMILEANGNLSVGNSTLYRSMQSGENPLSEGAVVFQLCQPLTSNTYFYIVNGAGPSGASTGMGIARHSTTLRSINAAGTINAAGADYAEYEYSNDINLVKGQIVGFKEDGTLTDKYSESIRFAIKSTNPSIVGGDVWGCENIVGIRPEKPVRKLDITEQKLIKDAVLGDDETILEDAVYETVIIEKGDSDKEWKLIYSTYEKDLADFEARLEAERQKVDRIAYAGKVPVNVYGAIAGQYVIAIEKEDGTIDGKLVNKVDMTFTEYQDAVGRVNKILDDGRAEVAVIIH